MQYHLDGFHAGDPDLHDPAPGRETAQGPLPENVDVLIVGCGPAGLTLAAQLAAFPDFTTRIVEQKEGPLERGQADGISCRSMEMFQAFGFADTVMRQGYWVNETTFWKPDAENPAHIARTGRIQDVEDGLSEMPHMILNQARVHDMYLDLMRRSPSRLVPDYGWKLTGLSVDEAAGEQPVTVQLEPTEGGPARTVGARYVVGCDGARSTVRRAIGLELKGDSASQAWGVMDVLAVTDFPDIRFKTLIQTTGEGNILIIPREGGYLVRLYIELDKLAPGERIAGRNFSKDHLIAAAKRIFAPYSFEAKEVVWWSVYEIGQRLTDRFDDLPEEAAVDRLPHVFIAGDACHTHSPKAGQGMNVSMGDAFNLGWKLVSVLQGRAGPDLLCSYSAERQAVAADLISFDREWASILSERHESGGEETPKFQRYFVEHGRYTAGLSVTYPPSRLIGTDTWQHLARGFAIGSRFHSAPVMRLADAKRMHLGHVIKADTRWRLFAFCPDEDVNHPRSATRQLLAFLAEDPSSPFFHAVSSGQDIDAEVDLRVIFQRRLELEGKELPALLQPRKGRYGLKDYEKCFCALPDEDIFATRAIDRDSGCVVIVRPDQHVAHILPFDKGAEVSAFLAGAMGRA